MQKYFIEIFPSDPVTFQAGNLASVARMKITKVPPVCELIKILAQCSETEFGDRVSCISIFSKEGSTLVCIWN